jgi:nucleotide-binding universal stress UspA family protein
MPTIVVGYIPSAQGLAAVGFATEEASLLGAHLVVVNTGHYGNYADPSFAGQQDLDALDAQLSTAGVEHTILQPTDGRSAAEEILAAESTYSADLIVIGLRRRSAVGKMLMGSTAQEVLLAASAPVMAVKAPEQPGRA